MPTLTSYTITSHSKGDFNITMTFSDASTSTQTIHFGHQRDDANTVPNPQTAQEKLTALVKDYAIAYQAGLNTATPTGSSTIQTAVPILVS